MPSEEEPLLRSAEEEPLIHNENSHQRSPSEQSRRSRVREVALFLWAVLATAAVIVVAVWAQHRRQTAPHRSPERSSKRNLIFMVSDGMGPASLSLTRSFRQHVQHLPVDDTLVLDQHFWGTSRTRSSSSLVTDSAAGATAFSCGQKSYNGAISVTPDYAPCGSVMEAAKRAGYLTGLVVTTDITDATPATFASHVLRRSEEDSIALQEVGDGPLGRSVDLMLGGGRCHFLPNSTVGGCREDEIDVTRLAREKHNWTYVDDRAGFDKLQYGESVPLPFLGLFASNDIPFEIDRRSLNHVYPSLPEMARTALRALEKATADTDKGFFLMIEGSRIDHAGHINDPAAQVHEVLAYDKTFESVLDFLAASDTEGVLVATSDHETGGLATALQEPGQGPVYQWYPQALANASSSCELVASRLTARLDSSAPTEPSRDLNDWVNQELFIRGLGITDATEAEISSVIADPSSWSFSAIISLRAHVAWSTHGHTAVDVNIYSSGGDAASALRGNVENTDVGKFLRSYLEVDVEEVTRELKEHLDLGTPDEGEVPNPHIARFSSGKV